MKFKVGDRVRNKHSGALGVITDSRHVRGDFVYTVKYDKYNPDDAYEDVLESVTDGSGSGCRSGCTCDETSQFEFDFDEITKLSDFRCHFKFSGKEICWAGMISINFLLGEVDFKVYTSGVCCESSEPDFKNYMLKRFNEYVFGRNLKACEVLVMHPGYSDGKVTLLGVVPVCSYSDSSSVSLSCMFGRYKSAE